MWSFWVREYRDRRREAQGLELEKAGKEQLRALRQEMEARLREERRQAKEAQRALDETVRRLVAQLEEYKLDVGALPPYDPTFIVIHSIKAVGIPDADAAGGADPYARFAILLDSSTPKRESAYTSYMVAKTECDWVDERLQAAPPTPLPPPPPPPPSPP